MTVAKKGVFSIRPPLIFKELRRGVLGQDEALKHIAVAIFKHTTGKSPGNILLIGNSGTGKTTIMNNIQRVYHDISEYRPFRSMVILNANLLVDPERMEFKPERLLTALEQRARAILGSRPNAKELKILMERATVCIDEIDKMSTYIAGKPNPIGVVLQQGLLTLMEGEKITYQTHAWLDGVEKKVIMEIDTAKMMFICGGAFEGLYDQVLEKVSKPGGQKLRSEAVRTADGKIRIETKFVLADHLKQEDLFAYGMVPQFIARFEEIVLLNDLSPSVLKEILLKSFNSPYVKSKEFFKALQIELELEDKAASFIAEEASKENRTGARALRPIFTKVIKRFEFDPFSSKELKKTPDGYKLVITAKMVKESLGIS